MKAIKLFSMAVAALILGACSNEDNDVQQSAQQARMIPFEATIGPAASANTRTVVKEGTGDYAGKLTVEWKGNEEIALVHNGTWNKVTVTKVNEDGSAVVSGSITKLGAEGEDAKLVYPYGAVASVEAGTANYTANTNNDFLAPGFAQDGTLEYISNNDLDGRVGTGILKTVGGITTIKKSATVDNVVMESKTAIWKLTLQDNAATPNAINAKTVTLKLGGVTIAGGKYDSGQSSYYICVVPATLTALYDLSPSVPPFTIEASDGTNTYTYTKTSKLTLENGKYYQSTVTMTKNVPTVNLSTVSGDTYIVTGDVILTGTPTESEFYIKYGGDDYEVTLDNVNSEGSKQVSVNYNNHNINIKLKGTSRLNKIDANYYNTVTIGEAAAGGTVIITGSDDNLIQGKKVTINGGTVKAKANEGSAVYVENNGDLIINGGALYLQAGGSDYPAVGKTASGSVTLYGWNESSWGTYTAGDEQKYASTDNSAAPSSWTW